MLKQAKDHGLTLKSLIYNKKGKWSFYNSSFYGIPLIWKNYHHYKFSHMSLIEPSINGDYLEKLLLFFQDQGLTKNVIFKYLPQLVNLSEQDWLSAKDLNQLYALACRELTDPFLGVRFGQTTSTNSFSIVGFMVISATNMLSALNSVLCYQSLYSRIGKMVTREENQQILLCWQAIWPRELMHPAAVEASITGWFNFVLKVADNRMKLKKVTFCHANDGCIAEYEKAFGCPVLFKQQFDAIYFDQPDLKQSGCNSNDLVHQALVEKADKVLATYGDIAFVEKIEAVLMQHGKGKILPIERVSEILNMGVGDVRKAIKKSNLSYRTILDRCKFVEALHYLLDDRLDLTSIAFQLGFSEQSGFTRAFKRWTQKSPIVYRSEILEAKPKL